MPKRAIKPAGCPEGTARGQEVGAHSREGKAPITPWSSFTDIARLMLRRQPPKPSLGATKNKRVNGMSTPFDSGSELNVAEAAEAAHADVGEDTTRGLEGSRDHPLGDAPHTEVLPHAGRSTRTYRVAAVECEILA